MNSYIIQATYTVLKDQHTWHKVVLVSMPNHTSPYFTARWPNFKILSAFPDALMVSDAVRAHH